MGRRSAGGPGRSIWSGSGPGPRLAVLALVATAAATLALGLALPVVYLRKGLSGDTFSVVAGILSLADKGNVLLASIVFAFSVAFPIAKLIGLVAILFRPLVESRRARTCSCAGSGSVAAGSQCARRASPLPASTCTARPSCSP